MDREILKLTLVYHEGVFLPHERPALTVPTSVLFTPSFVPSSYIKGPPLSPWQGPWIIQIKTIILIYKKPNYWVTEILQIGYWLFSPISAVKTFVLFQFYRKLRMIKMLMSATPHILQGHPSCDTALHHKLLLWWNSEMWWLDFRQTYAKMDWHEGWNSNIVDILGSSVLLLKHWQGHYAYRKVSIFFKSCRT